MWSQIVPYKYFFSKLVVILIFLGKDSGLADLNHVDLNLDLNHDFNQLIFLKTSVI